MKLNFELKNRVIMSRRQYSRLYLLIAFTCLLNLNFFSSSVYAQSLCKTPDQENGYCVPYKQCQKYVEYLQSTLSRDKFSTFVQQLRCNSNENVHLCCNELFITPTSLIGTNAYVSSMNRRGLEILSSMETCGDASTNRVAFGEEAKLREFPWMALLEYDTPSSNVYLCGGSLITDRYVLTAAHCMVGVDKIVAVILGEHNLDTDPDCQKRGRHVVCSPPRERYPVEKLIPHREYRKHQIGFDIALIKLNKKVELKKHIRPICLPITPYSLEQHPRFIIAGWGTTEDGSTSRVLKRATVEYQERSVCEGIYRRQRITSHHLCVGGSGPIDTCKGDSGGPLFIPTLFLPSRVRTVQYGIVSFGSISCSALEKYPALYTNITEFMPWITNNILD